MCCVLSGVLASYFFDFSVKDAVEDEKTQENFEYISTESTSFYNKHLKGTAEYLWNDIFIDLLWESFTGNLQKIKDGDSTVFEELAPSVDTDLNTTAKVTNPPIGEKSDE